MRQPTLRYHTPRDRGGHRAGQGSAAATVEIGQQLLRTCMVLLRLRRSAPPSYRERFRGVSLTLVGRNGGSFTVWPAIRNSGRR